VVPLADDDVGSFDEGPLQVGIALFDHPAIVNPAGAGFGFGHQAAVAGEVLRARKAVDRTKFSIDNDGQHFGRAGDGLDELHGWRHTYTLEDARFQLLDVFLNGVEDVELLMDAAGGFFGKAVDGSEKVSWPLGGENVAVGVQG